jgi:RNA polymerase sigma factor for flagellar operon FliA
MSLANELITSHEGYARALASDIAKMLPAHADRNDLFGFALLGLTQAANDYNPAMRVAFTTFAYYRIRGAVFDGIRKMTWLSPAMRRKLAREAAAQEALADLADNPPANPQSQAEQLDKAIGRAASVYLLSQASESDRPLEPTDEQSPDQTAESRELRNMVALWIKDLPADLAQIVDLIYFQELSMSEAGAKIGKDKATVSRRHAKAIDKLRELAGAAS